MRETKLDLGSLFLGQPLELKAGNAGQIEGLASVWEEPDSYGDVIERGAFGASLAEHRSQGTAPLMLWAHDTARPIGRWMDLKESAEGLSVRGQLNLKTDAGAQAFEHLKAGDLNGLSIGFWVTKGGAEIDQAGQRRIRSMHLAEISVVAIPAAKRARITEVRSHGDVRSILKGAGIPDRAARKMALGAFAALEGSSPGELEELEARAAEKAQLETLAGLIRQTLKRM